MRISVRSDLDPVLLDCRSQCRGFFFAGVVTAKDAAILSTSIVVATSRPERWLGKEGGSATPSRRRICATAARQFSASQSAAVKSTDTPLASLISIQYRRVRAFGMAE